MKQSVSPAIVGVVVVVLVAVVGFFVWKGTSGGGALPTGTTQQGKQGKGPIFDWMKNPHEGPSANYQDAVRRANGTGPSGGVSRPGGSQ